MHISKMEPRHRVARPCSACHTSILSIEHLTKLLNTFKISNTLVRLGRTKCSQLIKNVISPVYFKEIVTALKDQPFSLIIDELKDISCEKYLCVVIKFYSPKYCRIFSIFLGLIHVTQTDADTLYGLLIKFCQDCGINIKNCFSLATDLASNLCGVNNSLYTKLKENNTNLILLKCICHSLNLCCLRAFDDLPIDIDSIIRNTYSFFHRSSLRTSEYANLFKLVHRKYPYKFIPISTTRWLVRGKAINIIITQWSTLKDYFQLCIANCSNLSVAENLVSLYNHVNFAYLLFLKPILFEFESMNRKFQSEKADHCRLLVELNNFVKQVMSRIIKIEYNSMVVDFENKHVFKDFDDVDIGYECSCFLEISLSDNKLTESEILAIKKKCRLFLITLIKQLFKKVSKNVQILDKTPSNCYQTLLFNFN
ncbi:hypothetical protein A3Q56_06672 [Intoshia linei]|uniref:Uncharacterized protein n=1 Tax=Intoshia linei TaxID=1819745 RepID=A0A177AUE1_9BILA|nr:hypothetical protein A3Q56_06672 [Intoshia linei]